MTPLSAERHTTAVTLRTLNSDAGHLTLPVNLSERLPNQQLQEKTLDAKLKEALGGAVVSSC